MSLGPAAGVDACNGSKQGPPKLVLDGLRDSPGVDRTGRLDALKQSAFHRRRLIDVVAVVFVDRALLCCWVGGEMGRESISEGGSGGRAGGEREEG